MAGLKFLALIVFLWGSALAAQVTVTVAVGDPAETQRDYGKRMAKIAIQHGVYLENLSGSSVSIAPSAVLRRIAHLRPLTHARMDLLIADAEKNSGWARVGRAALDIGRGAAFMTASDVFKIKERWPVATFTGIDFAIPLIIARLQAAAVPVRQNYNRVAWIAPLQLGPGESGDAVVFSALETEQPFTFTLDTAAAPLRKSLQ